MKSISCQATQACSQGTILIVDDTPCDPRYCIDIEIAEVCFPATRNAVSRPLEHDVLRDYLPPHRGVTLGSSHNEQVLLEFYGQRIMQLDGIVMVVDVDYSSTTVGEHHDTRNYQTARWPRATFQAWKDYCRAETAAVAGHYRRYDDLVECHDGLGGSCWSRLRALRGRH